MQLLDPKLFLLGLYPEKHNYSKNERVFIDPGLLYAKTCIAMFWKKVNKPNTTQMDQTDVVMPPFRMDNLHIES